MYETIAILGLSGAAVGVLVQFVASCFWPTGKERPKDYFVYALIGAGGIFVPILLALLATHRSPHRLIHMDLDDKIVVFLGSLFFSLLLTAAVKFYPSIVRHFGN